MSLIAGDYNSDGAIDVIYGDDQWGEIHALDSQTGEELGQVDNPEHGVVGLSIGDYDGDGINEISWYFSKFPGIFKFKGEITLH